MLYYIHIRLLLNINYVWGSMKINTDLMDNLSTQINYFYDAIQKICIEKDILSEFEDYIPKNARQKGYYLNKGVYALFINDTTWKEFNNMEFSEKFDCSMPFYIGKTCNSFQSRVVGSSGHMQGGNTSVSAKLWFYLCNYNKEQKKCCYNNNDYIQHKKDVSKLFLSDNPCIKVKFLPINIAKKELSNFTISVIEDILISIYNPPLNRRLK